MDTSAPSSPPIRISGFKGINNRVDPTRLGLESQLEAVNVLCDDAGYLIRRPGNKPVATGYKDAYGTRNGRLLLIKTNDTLVERLDDGSESLWAAGVTGAPFAWAELGYALFVMSSTAQWAIYPDRVIGWGSLCPQPSSAVYPIGDPISYPPPIGSIMASRHSQLVVGVWEPARDRSVLYFSRPDFPHEFRLDKDWLLLPGRITLLTSLAQGLVIGTDRAIYIDALDSPLQKVADYGVPAHSGAVEERDFVVFMSERGLCRALPFQNLTDTTLAASLRKTVAAGIFPYQGSTYVVISQTGEVTQKPMTKPFVPVAITTVYSQGIA